jgi:hypothetical protein
MEFKFNWKKMRVQIEIKNIETMLMNTISFHSCSLGNKLNKFQFGLSYHQMHTLPQCTYAPIHTYSIEIANSVNAHFAIICWRGHPLMWVFYWDYKLRKMHTMPKCTPANTKQNNRVCELCQILYLFCIMCCHNEQLALNQNRQVWILPGLNVQIFPWDG